MHIPQSVTTATELLELAGVSSQIISPRECKPIISVVQDIALGIFRLTKNNVYVSDKQMMNLMSTNLKFDGNIPKPAYNKDGVQKWTGRQVLSTIIPKNISVKPPKVDVNNKNVLIIENGEIIQGTVDKNMYQSRTKGLVHSIVNECGTEEARLFFDNTQKLICNWLVNAGFSVGISDLIVDEETKTDLAATIHDMKVKVYDMIKNIHLGKFDNKSINSNSEYFEDEVNNILNQAREAVGKKALAKIDDNVNRMINMVKSGSKGSILNVSQMVACLGQQNVEGKRIAYGFDDRTLPHYVRYDDGPDSRGFVENSFIKGLSPQEFFFHAMGGREGLIDTAVKTSETGYLQRKLVKAMEDCKVNYDYTVRNASGSIVQFLYGEDGMDPVKIESQSFPYIEDYDYAKLCRDYLWTDRDDTEYLLSDELYKKMKDPNNELYPRLKKHFDQLVEDRHFLITKIFNYKQDSSIFYPVSFQRIITIAKSMFSPVDKGVLSDLDPAYVLDTIETLCQELFVSKANKGNKFMNILLRCFFSPKKVAFEYKFNRLSFDWVVQTVKARFYDGIVHASESVGVIAAQSIGEPTTQLCVVYSARVLVDKESEPDYCEMGKLIDDLLVKNKSKVIDMGNGSSVLDLDEDDIRIIGVSNDEKTSWRKISQVSRHPTKGNLLRVTTVSGRQVTATLAHSFLKRTENGIEPIKGADLNVGDRIPIARSIPNIKNVIDTIEVSPSITQKLTRDFGWFCGVYVADGSTNGNFVSIAKVIPEYQNELKRIVKSLWNQDVKTNTYQGSGMLHGWDMSKYEKANNTFRQPEIAKYIKEQFGESCYNKFIPAWVYTAPLEFVQGFIGGYVDGDGNVNGIHGKGMIRTGSVCERLTTDFILLLTRVGIYASKCIESHVKEENRKDIHTAQISRKYAKQFKEEIGLIVEFKNHALDDLINYVERDECHSNAELIDKIPEMANVLTTIGQGLKLEGQSRLYKRYEKKESIGRETLRKYYNTFNLSFEDRKKQLQDTYYTYCDNIKVLENHLEKTTPNNRGMIELPVNIGSIISDLGKGKRSGGGLGSPNGCGSMAQWKNLKTISQDTLTKFIHHFASTNYNDYTTECSVLYEKVAPAIEKVKSALDADVIWDAIESLEVIPDPFEYVYDFTVPGNDSFMVDCGVLVHNTLNTFHSSGISSASKAVRGVPRIKELLSVTKNIKTPNMTISVKSEFNQDKKKCTDIMNSIQTIFFKDIVKSTKIFYDPHDYDTTVEDDKLFMASYKEFVNQGLFEANKLSPWLLRMEFDREKMYDYTITMMDINYILTDFYDGNVKAMFSDDNANKLICRIKLEEDDNEERDFITELKALEKSILENLVVKGIKKVHKAVLTKKDHPRYNEETMQFEKHSEWLIDTSGTNLLEILGHSKIDATRTISNDINEIYEIFGIEAARQALFNELSEVLVELYVNYRHIALLVDTMTNKGYLLSIDRHGINRVDIGPLAKCSFEETTDMLIKAGIFSEIDKINGVSANIMLGQIPPCGTGDTQILIDETKLMESILEEEEESKMQDDAGISHITDEMKDNVCSFDNLMFDFKLPTVTGMGKKVDVDLKIV